MTQGMFSFSQTISVCHSWRGYCKHNPSRDSSSSFWSLLLMRMHIGCNHWQKPLLRGTARPADEWAANFIWLFTLPFIRAVWLGFRGVRGSCRGFGLRSWMTRCWRTWDKIEEQQMSTHWERQLYNSLQNLRCFSFCFVLFLNPKDYWQGFAKEIQEGLFQ